jgi:hypothetical protein
MKTPNWRQHVRNTILRTSLYKRSPLNHSTQYTLYCIIYYTTLHSTSFSWHNSPNWARASSLSRLNDHTQTAQSVGLLLTTGQPDTETSLPDNTQHSQETDIHAPGKIRTHNPGKQAAADSHLRPRGHWDRHTILYLYYITL